MNKEILKAQIKEFYEKYSKKSILVDTQIMPMWEYILLKYLGIINEQGIITCDYPLLSILNNDGLEYCHDYNGDINLIRQKVDEINNAQTSKTARIKYTPRYSLYKKLLKEIQEDYKIAEEIAIGHGLITQ
jgi:hypothetical protein